MLSKQSIFNIVATFLVFIFLFFLVQYSAGCDWGAKIRNPADELVLPSGCVVSGYRNVSRDYCPGSICQVPIVNCCGNKTVEGDIYDPVTSELVYQAEFCDGNIPQCRTDCTACGDRKIQKQHNEKCDKGLGEKGNGGLGIKCTADCQIPHCGDGILEVSKGEQCERKIFMPKPDHISEEQWQRKTCDFLRCEIRFF